MNYDILRQNELRLTLSRTYNSLFSYLNIYHYLGFSKIYKTRKSEYDYSDHPFFILF